MSAGFDHSCGLTRAGLAYCWGDNAVGQLGNGNFAPTNVPVAVVPAQGSTTPLAFSSISAGAGFTCAVAKGGAAYCWGYDGGQLGDGSAAAVAIPVPRPVAPPDGSTTPLTFVSVSAGQDIQNLAHACGIEKGGAAYCWGLDLYGRLGIAATAVTLRLRPTPVAPPVGGATEPLSFASISAGLFHTCAITKDGSAYCWGKNDAGQLGIGQPSAASTSPSPVVAPAQTASALDFISLSAGAEYSCGVAKGGTAYCWGTDLFSGYVGRLGFGTAAVVFFAPMAVAPPVGGSLALSFTSISTAFTHTCGVAKGGAAYCWGTNPAGQLGTGDFATSLVPVAVAPPDGAAAALTFTAVATAGFHTCGIAKGGGTWCWGDNGLRQLGNNDYPNDSNLPSAVSTP